MSRKSIELEIESVESEIEDAIHKGVTGTASHDGILENAIEAGQKRIKRTDRVWHKEVLHGFKQEIRDKYSGLYRIINFKSYAEAVDEGIAPKGEHGPFDAPPPPENLEPWVRDHMYIFDKYDDPKDASEALSKSLYQNGIAGVYFTESMMEYLRHEAEYDLERYVNRRLERRT